MCVVSESEIYLCFGKFLTDSQLINIFVSVTDVIFSVTGPLFCLLGNVH